MKKIGLALIVVLYFIAVFPTAFSTSRISSADYTIPDEVLKLSTAFKEEVGANAISESYRKTVESEVLRIMDGEKVFSKEQYLVFVDRNPAVQIGSVVYLDPSVKNIVIVGTFSVSTGNPYRRGHFETPIGVFKNSPENMSYRALGTKGSNGWRGLGKKGSRVWDFGWQETKLLTGSPYRIRLLIHATDPSLGEPRLGKADSKGCVRIPAKVNAFLDHYGILDASYKNGSSRAKSVLPRNGLLSQLAGQYLIVSDSRNL